MPSPTSKERLDPNICGDDGPITAESCALWLDAKYRRHGELEDRAAAMWLRKLSSRTYHGISADLLCPASENGNHFCSLCDAEIERLAHETCGDANLPEQLLMDCHDRMAFALEEIVDLKVSAPSPLGPLFGAGMSKGFEIATDIANRALEASCSPEQHDSAQQQSAQNGGVNAK